MLVCLPVSVSVLCLFVVGLYTVFRTAFSVPVARFTLPFCVRFSCSASHVFAFGKNLSCVRGSCRLTPNMTRKPPDAPSAPAPAGASVASAPAGRARRKHPAGPGRPRLGESERRTVTVALTLTPAERAEAEARARAAGLRLAPYLRACAGLDGPAGGDPAALASSPGPAGVERLALLREAVRQLGKVGSNVNQIARAANAALLADEPVAPQLAAATSALAALRAALADLREWPSIKVSTPAERGAAPRAAALEPGSRRGRR